mmetsp:Transcript_14560/g.20983  ORF Transcript_14560/g.20983 Transcript_14560/m.20983 type:complete len:148 (+) Transcript_14560:485-928(+)
MEDFQSEITEEGMIIHVLNNLPHEYDTEVAILEKRLGDKSNALTLEEIREDLSLRFEKFGGNNEESYDEDTNRALIAGKFKGRCTSCGKYGHKAKDCWGKNPKDGNSKKFNGKCNHCGKKGHKEADCYLNMDSQVRKTKRRTKMTTM